MCVRRTTPIWREPAQCAPGSQRSSIRVAVLESCVQTEDVTDLKGGAVVHHEVATDNYVYVVWGRRGKHRFQLARAGLYFLLQARRQRSIRDQLALEPRRKMIAFGQTRRQMIVVSAVPVADISVTVGVAVVTVTVAMPVAAIIIVVGPVIVVTIVLVVAVAIALGGGDGARECQYQQRRCASAE